MMVGCTSASARTCFINRLPTEYIFHLIWISNHSNCVQITKKQEKHCYFNSTGLGIFKSVFSPSTVVLQKYKSLPVVQLIHNGGRSLLLKWHMAG